MIIRHNPGVYLSLNPSIIEGAGIKVYHNDLVKYDSDQFGRVEVAGGDRIFANKQFMCSSPLQQLNITKPSSPNEMIVSHNFVMMGIKGRSLLPIPMRYDQSTPVQLDLSSENMITTNELDFHLYFSDLIGTYPSPIPVIGRTYKLYMIKQDSTVKQIDLHFSSNFYTRLTIYDTDIASITNLNFGSYAPISVYSYSCKLLVQEITNTFI